MSYTRPDGDAADFQFTGTAYTRPDGDAADFQFPTGVTDIEGVGAAQIAELTAAGVAVHGVSGTGAAVIGELTAAGVGEFEDPLIEAVGDATLDELTAAGVGAHGVAGAGAATIDGLAAEGAGAHGVSGSAALVLEIVAEGLGAHGVAGSGAATLGELAAAGVASHPRYSVKGEVRDAGVLVNRTVRAYRRDTGALVGEQLTTVGVFDIHAGCEAREHYVIPIHLDEAAVDWAPPVANRVVSVLAED
jgi:hypothetical protein